MKFRNVLIALVSIVIVGVAVHQLLSALTDPARIESVRRIEKTIAAIEHQPSAPAVPAPVSQPDPEPPTETQDAETIGTCDAWQALFESMDANPSRNLYEEPAVTIAFDIAYREKELDALTVEERDTLAAFVDLNQDLIGRIRDVATRTTVVCHFGSPDNYRQFQSFSDCDVWLTVDMLYRCAVHDFPLMLRDMIARCKVSRNHFFLGYADVRCAPCLSNALESGGVDDALWQELVHELAACRDRQNFVDDWVYITKECIEWYENTPAKFAGDHPGQPIALFMGLGYRYGTTPLRNYHATWFNDVMNDMLPVLALPYYQAEPKLQGIREDHNIRPMRDLPWVHRNVGTWFAAVLTYGYLERRARDEAEMDLARAAIVIEECRRNTGAYPESLESLAEQLGGEFPINPLLGEPYGYLHDEDSYRLWYEYIARPDDAPAERRAMVWPAKRETIGPEE